MLKWVHCWECRFLYAIEQVKKVDYGNGSKVFKCYKCLGLTKEEVR